MEIIEIDNHSKLPRDKMIGFICMSPMEAAVQFEKHYQQKPNIAYKVVRKSGKFSVYIPFNDALT